MLDFRKQFQEIIEQSYIPFNIDKAATSDVWSNIYKLILPNIPIQETRCMAHLPTTGRRSTRRKGGF